MTYFVSGTFVYGEQVKANSFEEAAKIFEETNCLSDKADLDGAVYVVNTETNEYWEG